MLCLLTLADVEAVSPDTLTPWKEELLWRLYVDTYNELTLGLRRRPDRAQSRPARRRCCAQPPGRLCRGGDRRFLEGLPRRYLQLFDREAPSIARAALARHPSRRSPPVARAQAGRGLGADRRHARQAVAVLEHLRRAVVVRHGHPARPRDDEPERPGARRLPVHRPERFLELNPDARDQFSQARGRRRRADPTSPTGCAGARTRRAAAAVPRGAPIVHADSHSSRALHDARNHRGRRAGPAVSDQPGDLAARLRRRPRADCDRGGEGHRRVSHHARAGPSWPTTRSARSPPTCSACWRTTMKLIKSIIRPNKVDDVKDALERS